MPNPANKPTIAVDIDDVLAANAKGFVEYSNKKWGTNLVPDDYHEHWALVWDVDEEEAEKRAKHIHANTSEIISNYDYDKTAKPVLNKLSGKYKLVIITSRRRVLQKDTFEWLEKYYPGTFEEIHFAGIWDEDQKNLQARIKATKADVVSQVGADYLIDDQPKHCIAVAEAGITAVLFGDYRWNRDIGLGPNMVKARNWQEVLEYFNRQKLSP